MFELPIKTNVVPAITTEGLCPWCNKARVGEPNSFVVINLGALVLQKKKWQKFYWQDKTAFGFFSLVYHGGDHKIFKCVDIVEDAPMGQFEIYFCSTECMRRFLNYCVDKLEEKIGKG